MEPQRVINRESIHLLGDRSCALDKEGPPVPIAMIVPMLVKSEPILHMEEHQDESHEEMENAVLPNHSLFQEAITSCSNEVDFNSVLTSGSELSRASVQSDESLEPPPLKITCVRSVAEPEDSTSPRSSDDVPSRERFACESMSSQERLSGLEKKLTESLERLNEATIRKTNALLQIVSVQERVAAVLSELNREKAAPREYLPEEFS